MPHPNEPSSSSSAPNPGAVGLSDTDLFDEIGRTRARLLDAIGQVIVGQQEVVDLMLIALFAGGHCLLVGVPGLAKTLLVRTAASALGLTSRRIQFTPDLMPADIIGTEVLEEDRATGRRQMRFIEGPLFTHLLLADEVNRTPPKTQAALLQAMQERAVTAGGSTRPLEAPFLVLATQNPIEQEGTYPLPEAQLDRFMFSIPVGYPSLEEEVLVVERTTGADLPQVPTVVDRASLLAQQALVRRMPTNPDAVRYAVRLARATRPVDGGVELARKWIQWGAGPRASQFLSLGAQVRAAFHGREVARVEDVKALAPAVLAHRLVLNFEAEASGLTAQALVSQIVAEVK